MAKNAHYELENTDKMEYAAWFVTSQTDSHVKVAIRGLDNDVFIDNLPRRVCIGKGACGKPLNRKITVDIDVEPGRFALKNITKQVSIPNDSNDVVSTVFMYSMEDYVDEDYNDITIHISTWKSRQNK